MLDEDQERNNKASWFDAPENTLEAQHIVRAGFQRQYGEDEEVNAELVWPNTPRHHPSMGLGMLVLLWLDTYRYDDEDNLVGYRAAAYSMFCETETRMNKKGPSFKEALREQFRRKRKLFVKKGEVYEFPILTR